MSDPNAVREVIHDLRNRLSAIASASMAIHRSNFDPEIGPEMVEIIRSNVEQATRSLVLLDRLGDDNPS